MVKYYKKEDSFTKYYIQVNEETKQAIGVYRNKDGTRFGINVFQCFPKIYEGIDYSSSTLNEFMAKLDFIKSQIK